LQVSQGNTVDAVNPTLIVGLTSTGSTGAGNLVMYPDGTSLPS
jgi:hypothetical protein